MTSLSEVYGDEPTEPRRQISRNKIGYLLMVLGGLLSFIGVAVGTTSLLQVLFDSTFDQIQLFGGVFTGTGVVMLIGGMLYSVPDKSDVETKLGAVGVAFTVFSIIWFTLQFPENWNIYDLSTVALVGFTYASGMTLLLIITFHAVVNYRLKSTERFTVTHRFEETHTSKTSSNQVENSQPEQSTPNGGGIGLIGNLPSESRETYGPRSPMTKEDRDRHSVGKKSDSRR